MLFSCASFIAIIIHNNSWAHLFAKYNSPIRIILVNIVIHENRRLTFQADHSDLYRLWFYLLYYFLNWCAQLFHNWVEHFSSALDSISKPYKEFHLIRVVRRQWFMFQMSVHMTDKAFSHSRDVIIVRGFCRIRSGSYRYNGYKYAVFSELCHLPLIELPLLFCCITISFDAMLAAPIKIFGTT